MHRYIFCFRTQNLNMVAFGKTKSVFFIYFAYLCLWASKQEYLCIKSHEKKGSWPFCEEGKFTAYWHHIKCGKIFLRLVSVESAALYSRYLSRNLKQNGEVCFYFTNKTYVTNFHFESSSFMLQQVLKRMNWENFLVLNKVAFWKAKLIFGYILCEIHL